MGTHEARTNATMNEEQPHVLTIVDEDNEPVKADTATDLKEKDLKEKDTKVKKGGTEETPGGARTKRWRL